MTDADYRAATTAAGVVALPERGLIAATGPLRQKFLHGILSNDVAARKPGQGCLAALMDVKGHLLALMRVVVAPDSILLELPRDRMAEVEALLVRYRVAAPVRFARADLAVLALVGPQGPRVLEAAGLPRPEAALESHAAGALGEHEVRVVRAGDMPLHGYVLYAPVAAVEAVTRALVAAGATAIDAATLDVLRVESGRPWYGPDVTRENLLHETGLLREYHSSSKGCYVGQEVVARLEGRGGNVNKLMRGLALAAPAAAGTAITAEGKEVGRITTAVVSPRLGPIALGYVHRSRAEPGSAVEVDGGAARVEALPFAGVTLAP